MEPLSTVKMIITILGNDNPFSLNLQKPAGFSYMFHPLTKNSRLETRADPQMLIPRVSSNTYIYLLRLFCPYDKILKSKVYLQYRNRFIG